MVGKNVRIAVSGLLMAFAFGGLVAGLPFAAMLSVWILSALVVEWGRDVNACN